MAEGDSTTKKFADGVVLFGLLLVVWVLVAALSLWFVVRPAEADADRSTTEAVLLSYAKSLGKDLENAVHDLNAVPRQPHYRSPDQQQQEFGALPIALKSRLQLQFSEMGFYSSEGKLLEAVVGEPAQTAVLQGAVPEPDMQMDGDGTLLLLRTCQYREESAILACWFPPLPSSECRLLVGAVAAPDDSMIEIPVDFPNPITDVRLRWQAPTAVAVSPWALPRNWWQIPLALLPLLLLPAFLLWRSRRISRDNHSLLLRLSESEKLSQSARQDRERIEMVRKISGGIAHDFKNFLTTILGNLSMIEEATVPERSEMIGDATNAAMVASELAHQLMAMSDQVEITPRLWRAHHLVVNAERLIRKVLPFDIKVELDVPEDLWSVQADSTHIGRVFHNLMVNAIHAMPEGGTIRFSARNLPAHAQAEGGHDLVEFEILDEGIGMAPEIIQRIFEPYFSTKGKESGKVNGLGLYNASTILHEHGGSIECSSKLGEGTSFRIRIPRAVHSEAEVEETIADNEALRLLVVDDEEIFRTLTTDLLTRYGFSVVTARDGKEAVEVASQSLEPFDLILLDLKMPVLSGSKVFRLLRERGVETPVVVCTGFPEQAQSFESEAGQAPDGVVLKPFDFEVLVKTVERVLNDDPRMRN